LNHTIFSPSQTGETVLLKGLLHQFETVLNGMVPEKIIRRRTCAGVVKFFWHIFDF
jgi:hypothetical protein